MTFKTVKNARRILPMMIFSAVLSNAAFAAPMGTGSSGGGDVIPDNNLSAPEIQMNIDKTKLMLPFVFQWLEPLFSAGADKADAHTAQLMNGIFTKVFHRAPGDSIQDILSKTNFELLEQGACSGPVQEDKDGSADASTKRVCLSAERLSKKLTLANVPSKLTALMAHEVSHLAGANEDEAQLIQGFVETNVSLETYNHFHDTFSALQDKLDEAIENTNSVEKMIPNLNGGLNTSVLAVRSVFGPINSLVTTNRDVSQGVAPFSMENFRRLNSVQASAIALTGFLYQGSERKKYEAAFGGKDVVSAVVYGTNIFDSDKDRAALFYDASIPVYRVAYGNKVQVLKNLRVIEAVLKKMKKDLDSVQVRF